MMDLVLSLVESQMIVMLLIVSLIQKGTKCVSLLLLAHTCGSDIANVSLQSAVLILILLKTANFSMTVNDVLQTSPGSVATVATDVFQLN